MFVLMSRFDGQPPPLIARDLGSPPGVPSNEAPNVQNQVMQAPSSISTFWIYTSFWSSWNPQFEGEIFVGVDKETKKKMTSLKDSLSR